jgi:hypothetical protein
MKIPPALPQAAPSATQPPPRRLELRDLAELLAPRPKAAPQPAPPAPEAAPQAPADQRPLRPGSRLDIKV